MSKEAKSKWNGFSLKPRKEMPEGLWTRCPGCEHMLYKSNVEENLNVCPECKYHFRIDAATRIKYLVDEDSFQQILAVDKAIEEKLPLVAVCCSGGAMMHEGVVSLGQMAKTSAVLAKLDEAKGLFISILTDPTTGGVTASFAMLGDVTIAEPGALIGFAGPRTIAETIKVELPEGFQTAEFMLEHGFVDMIVQRKDLRSEVARIIDYCQK